MDRDALKKLRRADLQKLAKRDGVRANQKTEAIINELLEKNNPVPYIDPIPSAFEQVAVPARILQEASTETDPLAESISLRRSPCKNNKKEIQVADVGPAFVTSLDSQCPSISPRAAEGDHTGLPEDACLPSGYNASLQSNTESPHTCEVRPRSTGTTKRSLENAIDNNGDCDSVNAIAPRDATRPTSSAATDVDVLRTSLVQPSGEELGSTDQSIAGGEQRRPGPLDRPDPHLFQGVGSNVFCPPTDSQCVTMRERAAQQPLIVEDSLFFQRDSALSLTQQEDPGPTKPTLTRSRSASTEPAWGEMALPPPPPLVSPRPISEVRRILQAIAPLTDRDEKTKAEVRELGMLIDHVEERTTSLKMRMRKMQKLRLVLEYFFSQFKDDPRLLDGTWASLDDKEGSTRGEMDVSEVNELVSQRTFNLGKFDVPDVGKTRVAEKQKAEGKRHVEAVLDEESESPKRQRRSKAQSH
ncbi:hypothetical protein C8Q79DRAFT_761548 [Trametes meyenii]|nr:hypothetical protein C8Q79DRAFT_761548 [Trametes meyenii]